MASRPIRVGFTGHQGLSPDTARNVHYAVRTELESFGAAVIGLTSLAEGSDQIFASEIERLGGGLKVIVPCKEYETTFGRQDARARFERFVASAVAVEELDFPAPSEEAFWAAGRAVADEADVVLAVWDGKPAGGLGGTADVVRYARDAGREVRVIWPEGASRASQ